MKLYTCTSHDLHYPIGCGSIVVAASRVHGKRLLDVELESRGLKPWAQSSYLLEEVKGVSVSEESEPQAIILCDGNY